MKKSTYWFLVVILSIFLFGFFGYGLFYQYKISRYNDLGSKAISENNWPLARFWYSKTLELDKKNKQALKDLTTNASFYRDPSALTWWKLRLKASPSSDEARFGLVELLLRLNRIEEAKRELDLAIPKQESQAKYKNLYTAYYIAVKDYDRAEEFARQSLESASDSVDLKLNLLNILLYSGNRAYSQEINQILADLFVDETNMPKVWRVLLAYAVGQKKWDQAISVAEKLANHDEGEWYEKLAYIKLLVKLNPDKLDAYLRTIMNPEPLMIEETSRALTKSGNTEILLGWLNHLTENGYEEDMSIQMARSDAYASAEDWDLLIETLESLDWSYFDYYRNLHLSRAYKAKGQKLESDKHWTDALHKAHESGVHEESRLARIVESWPEYKGQWIELVEEMLKDSVHAQWAYNKLQAHYFELGATWELYRISQIVSKIINNDSIKNNRIMQALLLNEKVDEQLDEAKLLFDKYPGKPIPTSTYAFALYKNEQYNEAYDLLKSMDVQYINIAEIAHYAAVIALGAGHQDESDLYLEKAQTASLLPEEKALISH